MIRRAACALIALFAAAPCAAAVRTYSELALPVVDAPVPELVLAQRAIERSWGPSPDSVYVEIAVPEWRSEGLAMSLSAALPGAGQLYVGERSGLWYALAEAAGWALRWTFDRRADELRDDAIGFVGSPDDSASAWSFERWSDATGEDAAELRALYDADREAFLHLIATSERYLAGWGGDPVATRGGLRDLQDDADVADGRRRWAEVALWANHLVAAADALRAARIHNLPLRRNLELELRSSWRNGRPRVYAVLERRF